MNSAQKEFITKMSGAVGRAHKAATEARAIGLPVLGQFLDEVAHMTKTGIEYQYRAFRDTTLLTQVDKVVVERQTNLFKNT